MKKEYNNLYGKVHKGLKRVKFGKNDIRGKYLDWWLKFVKLWKLFRDKLDFCNQFVEGDSKQRAFSIWKRSLMVKSEESLEV